MLTQPQNQAAREAAAGFTAECVAYKALLAEHKLPLSVNLHRLTEIYRSRLFEQLLVADTGLQARYDLARTAEGKQRIQTDTMAGIDLRGHELPDALAAAITSLEQAWRAVPMLNDVPHRELTHLADGYGLDYGSLLDKHTMMWEGKEAVVAYFKKFGTALTEWRALMRALGKDTRTLDSTMAQLAYYFPNQLQPDEPIAVDEEKLYKQLQYNPKLLELVPTVDWAYEAP